MYFTCLRFRFKTRWPSGLDFITLTLMKFADTRGVRRVYASPRPPPFWDFEISSISIVLKKNLPTEPPCFRITFDFLFTTKEQQLAHLVENS